MSSHKHFRKRQAPRRLLSLILPNRIARRIFPGTLPTIDGPSISKATLHLDVLQDLHRVRVTTPPVLIDGLPESGATHHLDTSDVLRVSSCDKCRVTINILPDDVLLHIFHLIRAWRLSWEWHRLVHVCWRWRSVVFVSPNFLDLRLVCGPRTRVQLTDIWPPLPIIIRDTEDLPMPEDYDFAAATVHNNRVCEINLVLLTSSQLQRLASAMQEPFPALTHLMLNLGGDYSRQALSLPDGFLGGSAPRLQSLWLRSIPSPALPKLLSSATSLVRLSLWNIPHSGYISPENIVTSLAMLSNLESLTIDFESPLSRPKQESRHPPLPTRTVLPALTRFEFKGVSEYLEDLVALVNTPLLNSICITFFHQLIFDLPQLAKFMRRTTRFQALDEAYVNFGTYGVQVIPLTQTGDEESRLKISCKELDWQLSSVAQVFASFFPSIYMVEHLYIHGPRNLLPQWQDDIESMQWLEILHPFTTVKNLYVSENSAQCIAPALQELVGGRVTEVLPALESLFMEELLLSGPVGEAIEQFVAARQVLGRPVTVSRWNRT